MKWRNESMNSRKASMVREISAKKAKAADVAKMAKIARKYRKCCVGKSFNARKWRVKCSINQMAYGKVRHI